MRCAFVVNPLVALVAVLVAGAASAHADEPSPPERTVAVVSARVGGDADVELRSQRSSASGDWV
jgi:hypothetical protein